MCYSGVVAHIRPTEEQEVTDSVFMDDLKTKNCRVCHHPYPVATLVRGICEDCLDEIENDAHGELGFVKNGRKRGYDDE